MAVLCSAVLGLLMVVSGIANDKMMINDKINKMIMGVPVFLVLGLQPLIAEQVIAWTFHGARTSHGGERRDKMIK